MAYKDFERVLSEHCVDIAQYTDMCSDTAIMEGNNSKATSAGLYRCVRLSVLFLYMYYLFVFRSSAFHYVSICVAELTAACAVDHFTT